MESHKVALIPVFKPPTPSSLYTQSTFDRIRLLLSLSPKSTIAVRTFSNSYDDDSKIINRGVGFNSDESKQIRIPHNDMNLFGGKLSIKEQPKPTTNRNPFGFDVDNHHNKRRENSPLSHRSISETPMRDDLENRGRNHSFIRESKKATLRVEGSSTEPAKKKPKNISDSDPVEHCLVDRLSRPSAKLPDRGNDSAQQSSLFKSEDFSGTGTFCKNAGTSTESLNAFLSMCCGDITPVIVISCIWHDLVSNTVCTTSRHCTPSASCSKWYCSCDRHIRVEQAFKPLLGVAISIIPEKNSPPPGPFSTQVEAGSEMYFLPLAPCSNHKADDWKPSYLGTFATYLIPLQCSTTLEERFAALMRLLSSEIKKIIFHSQLFLLPILASCLHRLSTGTPSQWASLNVKNIVDPRICAHLIDSDVTAQQLELAALLTHFSIPASRGADMEHHVDVFSISANTVKSTLGRVSRALHSLKSDMEDVLKLTLKLMAKLEEWQSIAVLETLEMPLVPVLVETEIHGVGVSSTEFKSIRESVARAVERITVDAHESVGVDFNLGSPDQIASLLYDKLKLPAPALVGNKRHASTSEEDLIKICGLHPVVQLILDFRSLSKISSTYINGLEPFLYSSPLLNNVHSDAGGLKLRRAHARWNHTSVRTGRLSCSQPNLQNIPKNQVICKSCDVQVNTRNLFEASSGCVFVAADYSQVEMRVLAHVSGDAELRALFLRQGDIYRHLAGLIFGVTAEEVEEAERERAKVICLGSPSLPA